MIRLAVSVEGRTEEEFVNRILADHLRGKGVEPTPIMLGSGRGRGARGGNVGANRLAHDMSRWFWNFDAVTSLVDFYGFRDKGAMTVVELEEHLMARIQQRVRHGADARKIIPYVQQHEFEGLLFSDVRAFSKLPDVPSGLADGLRQIRTQFPTPEDINDSHETAPSKRILNLMPRYRKVDSASFLAEEMGLDVIRAECPRFDHWLVRLESLPADSGATSMEEG